MRPCLFPRCPALVPNGYCAAHGASETRPPASQRGYGRQWRSASAAYLREEAAREGRVRPRCRIQSRHCTTDGTMVDHIQAHKGDPALFWSRANWQPACTNCNRWKANTYEGGFGNPIRALA